MKINQGSWLRATVMLILLGIVVYLHLYQQQVKSLIDYRVQQTHQHGIIKKLVQDFWDVIMNTSIIDPNGHYYVLPKVLGGSKQTGDSKDTEGVVTLVSHCSINHLSNLINLSKIWEGPIIVTVFLSYPLTEYSLRTILNIFLCSRSYNEQVTINLVHPLPNMPSYFGTEQFLDIIPSEACEALVDISGSFGANYADDAAPYPNNLLRNVGITYAKTNFVFVVDIDMIPNENLHSQFASFIQQHDEEYKAGSFDMNAFIVPAFEMSSNLATPPKNKEQLIEQMVLQNIRPFYTEVCLKCQSNTLYETWRNVQPSTELDIAYTVPWADPWEPFYIAKRKPLPLYQGKFMQFGFNRISQVCELHVAGYNFSILNNAFLVHQGFKNLKSFHETKQQEQERNRQLFREFKEDLKLKYKNDRRC